MKVLVTGAKGMLGGDLVPLLKKENLEVFDTDIEELDITNLDIVYKIVKDISPDLVINCAAYTHVDKAEEEPDKAFLINGIGAQNIALVCNDFNIELCHLSTDYVFDGEKRMPYSPFDNTNPINTYGLSKLSGERYIQWVHDRFYIIRTSWLYGKYGKNYVKTILELVKSQSELKVVNDQISSPTWTITLSRVISKIIKAKKYGIYHVSDETKGGISWYKLAQEIIKLTGHKSRVIPIKTEEFPRKAKRPKNSVLDLTMTKLILNDDLPSWKESLRKFLNLKDKRHD